MPRIYTSVNESTIEKLKDIQGKEKSKSFSRVVCDIIELGLKAYDASSNTYNTSQSLHAEQNAIILRILAATSDILRCVHDETKVSGETAEETLNQIKVRVGSFIDGAVGNEF